jgi:hypothetical protein
MFENEWQETYKDVQGHPMMWSIAKTLLKDSTF